MMTGVGSAGGAPPFSPSDIPGLLAWYDAADAATFTFSSGVVVSQWNDKSGNGENLVQGTVARQPSRSGTQNGLPTVVYDGSTDSMAAPAVPFTQPFTIAMVVKTDNPDTADRYGVSISGGGFHTSTTWREFFGADLNSGVADDALWHLIVCIANGLSSQILLDGASIAAGAAGAGVSLNALTVGSWPTPSNFWDGEFGEVMIWNSALGAPDLASVLAYSQSKWATP